MKLAINDSNKIFALDSSLIDFSSWGGHAVASAAVESTDIIKQNTNILRWNGSPLGTTWAEAPGPAYPTDGLVSRYIFEDNMDDSYGSNNGWTPLSAPGDWTYTDGLIDKSFTQTGTSDYDLHSAIYTTDSGLTSLAENRNTVSISAWYKITYKKGATRLCAFTSSSSSADILFGATVDGDGDVRVYRNGSQLFEFDTDIVDSLWHHYVVTYDGTNAELYIDNDSKGSTANTDNLSAGAVSFTGQLNNGYWYFTGQCDCMYFYNKALSTDEISQLYNSGAGV